MFNRKTGCKTKKGRCPHGVHVCTVCGSAEHGASFHTPEPKTVRLAKKRVAEEISLSETMTAAEKAEALSEQRSDKRTRK